MITTTTVKDNHIKFILPDVNGKLYILHYVCVLYRNNSSKERIDKHYIYRP